MKFLFFTDTHIRGNNPQNRIDDFVQTLNVKLREVFEIAKNEEVDIILHGGDIFDRPDISPALVREFVLLLNDYTFPLYAVAGNHDIYGQNPNTLNRTMLGLLDSIGIIKIIKPGEKIYFKDDLIKIQLTGQSYFYGIDRGDRSESYIVQKDSDVDFAIHMVHGMLLKKPFFEGMDYTLIEEISTTQADITLSGHYHSGFNSVQIENKYFLNPGGLVRINNSMNEFLRMPKIYIINIENKDLSIEEIPLKCAQQGDKVLDRSKIEAFSFKEKKLAEFMQSIYSTGQYNTINLNNIINEISHQDNIKTDVIQEALRRIGLAQENLGEKGNEDYPEVI